MTAEPDQGQGAGSGTAEQASAEQGSADSASAEQGSAEQGSAEQGSAEQGSAGSASAEQGSADSASAGRGQGADQDGPAWRRRTAGEPRWHAAVLVLVAIGLQLALPARLGLHPKLLLPGLEAVLLVALMAANPGRIESHHPALRYGSIATVVVITVANAGSAALLIGELLRAQGETGSAGALLASGSSIYLTNIIAFGLWYWEVDLGGPARRAHGLRQHPDLMFPQMSSPDLAPPHWEPTLVDYVYVSYTNALAFSPTDTLPMPRWTKIVMALQSTIALVTLALVIARSVNILK